MDGALLQSTQHTDAESVTSVGNSWIICRSKSHSGRIYYFNTLTGEAAWNLSDSEIEKAKNTTRILQSQSGGTFQECPEPKDPPMEVIQSFSNKKSQQCVSSRVYNKQIINNQYSKQTISPMVKSCNCNTVNVPGSHNCNPNIWAIPPNHQIVIAPAPAMGAGPQNTSKVFDTFNQHLSVQNTSLPLSRRFHLLQNENKAYYQHPNKMILNYNSNFVQRRNPYMRRSNDYSNSNDLRRRLSARNRNNSWNRPSDDIQYEVDEEEEEASTIHIIKPGLERVKPTDVDDEWLKENAYRHEGNLILDVTSLKNFMGCTKNTATWYIVGDTNVLMHHINLIHAIVNSDEQCQLMVPDFVMIELQNISRQSDMQVMSRAHNVLQILSQQFLSNCAVIGKDSTRNINRLPIFHFCLKLSRQQNNLVLVSNNIQLERYKNISEMPIVTMKELKEMLTRTEPLKPELLDAITNCNIEITVQNDIPHSKNKYAESDNDQKPHVDSIQHINLLPSVNNGIRSKTDLNVYTMKTVSIGVQTDFIFNMNTNPTKSSKSTNTDSFYTGFSATEDLYGPKRREIRLKRNLSHQLAIDENKEKKKFKWRRRKSIVSAPQAVESDCQTRSYSTSPIRDNDLKNCHIESIFSNNNNMCSENKSTIASSESSFYQSNILKNTIVEETSSSSIISNTASNVNSESLHSLINNGKSFNVAVNEEKDKIKCAMFEVDSSIMEESLRTRCDEWISRFVQIMEEVLSQILQLDPPFFNRTLPPPWSMHEATECIKKKFCNDGDIVDAANRLASVLFKISDGRGKIRKELKPIEFMEMYSYGVYLVDSLQSVLSQCEDLQTAADSLAKLLSDIQDPNDTSHTDSFLDVTVAPAANVTHTASPRNSSPHTDKNSIESKHTSEQITFKSPSSSGNTERTYNLRSSQKKILQRNEERDNEVKFIRNLDIEVTYFASLNLKKNNINSGIRETSTLSNTKENENIQHSDGVTTESGVSNNEHIVEPKIIRKFSKRLEFEESLKSKRMLDFDQYDFEEQGDEKDDYDDYDEEYDYEDYSSNNPDPLHETDNFGDSARAEYQVSDNNNVNKNEVNNKPIIGNLMKEIRDALFEVHSFCDKTRDELLTWAVRDMSGKGKLEILDKAEKAQTHMNSICESLNSILNREDIKCEDNIEVILKESGIHLDIIKSAEYRNTIMKYSSQANMLLEAVNIIIETVK